MFGHSKFAVTVILVTAAVVELATLHWESLLKVVVLNLLKNAVMVSKTSIFPPHFSSTVSLTAAFAHNFSTHRPVVFICLDLYGKSSLYSTQNAKISRRCCTKRKLSTLSFVAPTPNKGLTRCTQRVFTKGLDARMAWRFPHPRHDWVVTTNQNVEVTSMAEANRDQQGV